MLAGDAGDRDHVDAGGGAAEDGESGDLCGGNVEGQLGKLSPASARAGRDEWCGALQWPGGHRRTVSRHGRYSSGGFVIFDPAQYKERAGLLVIGSSIYLAWASHCDYRPYTGWITGYNINTLAQKSVLNVTPNGNEGAIWGSGAGMAADGTGNIILLDANGVFD